MFILFPTSPIGDSKMPDSTSPRLLPPFSSIQPYEHVDFDEIDTEENHNSGEYLDWNDESILLSFYKNRITGYMMAQIFYGKESEKFSEDESMDMIYNIIDSEDGGKTWNLREECLILGVGELRMESFRIRYFDMLIGNMA